jgi:hypothetical protein
MFKPTIGAYEYPPLNFFMWTGLINGDWNNAGNWIPAGVPGLDDDVGIPADPASDPDVFPNIANGVTSSCDELYLGPESTVIVEPGGTLIIRNENP